VLLVTGLLTLTGCTRWNMLKGPERKTPIPPNAPSVAALVDYLNNNSQRVQTLRCMELDLTCTADSQSVGLRGKMIAQKPRNFLMGADSLGKRMVDLGSNDQEFWYWISQNDPPHQFYCGYKALEEGTVRHMPFPFQPNWVIETLGLGNYGPAERYKLETDAESIKLVEPTRSPQGKPVRKVIVMNRRPVQPPRPQVTAFMLVDDATGKEICSAHITETQLDHSTGAVLPRRIEFRWIMPEHRLKLAMKLDGITVNPSIPATTFARRPLNGVPSFNLANGQLDPVAAAPLQRVQGFK
jgi:hypothetical protein